MTPRSRSTSGSGNLRELASTLRKLNIPLKIAHPASVRNVPQVVLDAARGTGCESLHFNCECEVDESRRDEKTIAAFESAGLEASAWHDQVVFPPDEIRTQQERFCSVFSPFKRAWITMAQDRGIEAFDSPKKQPKLGIDISERIDGFDVPRESRHFTLARGRERGSPPARRSPDFKKSRRSEERRLEVVGKWD